MQENDISVKVMLHHRHAAKTFAGLIESAETGRGRDHIKRRPEGMPGKPESILIPQEHLVIIFAVEIEVQAEVKRSPAFPFVNEYLPAFLFKGIVVVRI